MVGANRAAATTGFVNNWQGRGFMLLERAAGILNGLVQPATSRSGVHNFFDRHLRSPPVIRRDVMAHIALGHDTN